MVSIIGVIKGIETQSTTVESAIKDLGAKETEAEIQIELSGDVLFDFDKWNIRPDAEIEIQKVVAAMEKYPSLKVKVNSHTDSRGPDAYNLWLSQKRADATVRYMISKGIAPERLTGEGFGETRLINQCANGVRCSDTDHELNRRSEFIIME